MRPNAKAGGGLLSTKRRRRNYRLGRSGLIPCAGWLLPRLDTGTVLNFPDGSKGVINHAGLPEIKDGGGILPQGNGDVSDNPKAAPSAAWFACSSWPMLRKLRNSEGRKSGYEFR